MDTTERPYRISIGDIEYAAAPLPEEHVIIMTTLRATGGDMVRSVKTLCRIVETAVGRESWDKITDRWMTGEISFSDIGEKVTELVKLTVAEKSQQDV